MKAHLLGCRSTTQFTERWDDLASRLDTTRSELMRYALHNFLREANTKEATFNHIKQSII